VASATQNRHLEQETLLQEEFLEQVLGVLQEVMLEAKWQGQGDLSIQNPWGAPQEALAVQTQP